MGFDGGGIGDGDVEGRATVVRDLKMRKTRKVETPETRDATN